MVLLGFAGLLTDDPEVQPEQGDATQQEQPEYAVPSDASRQSEAPDQSGTSSSAPEYPANLIVCDIFYDEVRPAAMDLRLDELRRTGARLEVRALLATDDQLADNAHLFGRAAVDMADGQPDAFEALMMLETLVRNDCERLGLE